MKRKRTIALLASIFFVAAFMPLSAQTSRPKVAVVLEGGGAWGFAHIGVLKVIEQLGIPVDIVVGTSMGSIVGGLYASGYSATEIETLSVHADWTDLFIEDNGKTSLSCRDSLDRASYAGALQFDRQGVALSGGLISGNKIVRFFDSLLVNTPSPADFDALPRRFRAVATDVSNGDRIVYSKGSLPDAMRASMSIPGVFSPFYYDGHYLVDGGLVDNLPVDIAREMGADIIIAVDLFNPRQVDAETINRSPMLSLAQSIDIALRANVKRQLPGADLVIPVNMDGFLAADFAKAQPIAALGETAARTEIAKLKAIKERLGDAEITPVLKAEVPPVSRIVVMGGSTADNAKVNAIFSPLVGTNAEPASFQRPFSLLDQSGSFELVRVYRDSTQDDKPLVVKLKEKTPPRHELKFGFLYSATFAHTSAGNLDIKPAVILRGLTTHDSQLRVEGELLDTPDISISFIQPVGDYFSVTPRYAYVRSSTLELGESSFVIEYQTGLHTAGLSFDVTPVNGVDWNFGWHYDWIVDQYVPAIIESTEVTSASIFETGLQVRKLDSPVFPMDGIDAKLTVKLALTEFGSERFFRVFETEGSSFLSLGTPFSVALLWKGGTDFSTGSSDPNAAPWIYRPSLASRRMFPGPLNTEDQIGSHVAGVGIEIKHNLNWKSKGVTLPVFTILQSSVGTVIQDTSAVDMDTDIFHGNVVAGLGLRVNDAFGILFRVGVQSNLGAVITPFIALDIGSIGL